MIAFWRERRVSEIHCPRRFRQIMERERSRADRTGEGFWLIVFTVPRGEAPREMMTELAERLNRRLRLVDEVGWMDQRHLAALLPTTSSAGVNKIGEELLSTVPTMDPLPEYKHYYYPTDGKIGEKSADHEWTDRREFHQAAHSMETMFVRSLPPWKRGLDLLGALIGLIVLSPLFAIVSLAIKVSSSGPVLFRQPRAGLGGKPFTLYKFRSMVDGAEKQRNDLQFANELEGPVFKIKEDPRATSIGHFLRSTSIDELPQLYNVLKGDMSLVGPRPLPIEESLDYETWQRQRLEITPGLTCIWQVSGRSHVSFTAWMRMDHQYIRSRSLRTDAKLLLKTIPAVLFRRGAF